jgi:hypothetical protein
VSIALHGMHGLFEVLDTADEGDDDKIRHEPVRLMQSAFREFLTDHERSKHFSINPILHHGDLAQFCLTIATRMLKQDMCSLGDLSFSQPNSSYSDLAARCNNTIPSALRYACRHWASHLLHTSFRTSVVSNLRTFADKSLKPWIETLSLLDELHLAVMSMKIVKQRLKVSSSRLSI